MDKVVILAAGLGKRMRQPEASAELTAEQEAIAKTGIKALIPIDRPFLDYVLSSVADAGYRRVCLVIAPHHAEIRDYYTQLNCKRIEVSFAVQHEPLGTADAVASAAEFIEADSFLTLNSDNYYPTTALRQLREMTGPAVVGFRRDALLQKSNIPADRIAKYAIMQTATDGSLQRIVEKPEPAVIETMPEPILVNMNCWRFSPEICVARHEIPESTRGEYEIPDAVTYSMQNLGCRYPVIESTEAVLDLSHQHDVAAVADHLRDVEVEL
jgi:dTDP-glucose pyrophosphorylase